VEEGSSAHLFPFSSLKLLAVGVEKGLLDLPAHFKTVRRRKELYPTALKNTKRSLQFEASIELAGQSTGEAGREALNRITGIFILTENCFPLKGPSGLLHSTLKSLKALQIPSENSGLGLIVLSSH